MDKKKALQQLKEIAKRGGNMRLAAENWNTEFKTLIATLLSARSLDETTIKYATILFEKYPDAESLSKAKLSDVEEIIYPINFYKNKSKNIIQCSKELIKRHNGQVPKNFEALTNLRGVGRKTANVFLAVNDFDEIGVDTHVNYISHYLEWTNGKNQEEVEKDLKNLFPKSYWRLVNYYLVKFGKKYTSKKEKNRVLDEIKAI